MDNRFRSKSREKLAQANEAIQTLHPETVHLHIVEENGERVCVQVEMLAVCARVESDLYVT